MPPLPIELLFCVIACVLGAVVGSFLNVVIYRLPRGLSVNEPRRSFCPSCKHQLPWHLNLPLISWPLLRGRCAFCKTPISARYLVVEALTAALFLAVWIRCYPYWGVALVLMLFTALLVAATFIDIEHYIIPDEITWGGVVAGVVLSAAVPRLMGAELWWVGALWSLFGAALGYFGLWGIVEVGKLAFGRLVVNLADPEPFRMLQEENDVVVEVGTGGEKERLLWSDLFARKSDRLRLTTTSLAVNGQRADPGEVVFGFQFCEVNGKAVPWETLQTMEGTLSKLIVPREAMGFGDVKFLAAIGAFLGWKGVLFTIVGGSMTGAIFSLAFIALGHREWSHKVPFGPYLALGALLWIFVGPECLAAYSKLLIVLPDAY